MGAGDRHAYSLFISGRSAFIGITYSHATIKKSVCWVDFTGRLVEGVNLFNTKTCFKKVQRSCTTCWTNIESNLFCGAQSNYPYASPTDGWMRRDLLRLHVVKDLHLFDGHNYLSRDIV